MHPLPFLQDFLIILAAAVVIIFVSRPLKLPSVVGFLLTGLLIGPSGLHFIQEKEQIEIFAELGVVMLLFFVGLEFSLAHLRTLGRQFFGGGALQIVLTTLAISGIAITIGFAVTQAVFFGALIALSSTAIVLKILADRAELDTQHGKLAIGILLFQDFCIVPMIVLTPLLSGQAGVSFSGVVTRLALSIGVVVIVFYAARFLMPKALYQIARTKVREAFLMASLLVCLLMAALTASLGFSYALGAFIAGLIVSESEYSHEVVAEIVSFRDLFTSLFFISVGMLLDLNFVFNNVLLVVSIGVGILLLKAAFVFIAALLLNFSFRTAVITAVSLSQIGEFSFVLATVGKSVGLLDNDLYQRFLSASVFTMIFSPPLIAFSPAFAERIQNVLFQKKSNVEQATGAKKSLTDHVVIVGFGVNGQNIARVLRETGIPYIVIESDGDIVHHLQREKIPVMFGDATRKDILHQCAIQQARLIVFAISDPPGTRTAVRLARSLNQNIHIIVRTRLVSEIEELEKLGADEVIPEEFETSIEIFTRVLDHYHIPRNVINAQIKVIRDENYSMLRGLPMSREGLNRVAQLLAAGTADTFLVTEESHAAGKSLGELNIASNTGAAIIAVVRGEQPFVTPAEDFAISPSDTLILVGTHANMDKAFEYLSQPPTRKPTPND